MLENPLIPVLKKKSHIDLCEFKSLQKEFNASQGCTVGFNLKKIYMDT